MYWLLSIKLENTEDLEYGLEFAKIGKLHNLSDEEMFKLAMKHFVHKYKVHNSKEVN